MSKEGLVQDRISVQPEDFDASPTDCRQFPHRCKRDYKLVVPH